MGRDAKKSVFNFFTVKAIGRKLINNAFEIQKEM